MVTTTKPKLRLDNFCYENPDQIEKWPISIRFSVITIVDRFDLTGQVNLPYGYEKAHDLIYKIEKSPNNKYLKAGDQIELPVLGGFYLVKSFVGLDPEKADVSKMLFCGVIDPGLEMKKGGYTAKKDRFYREPDYYDPWGFYLIETGIKDLFSPMHLHDPDVVMMPISLDEESLALLRKKVDDPHYFLQSFNDGIVLPEECHITSPSGKEFKLFYHPQDYAGYRGPRQDGSYTRRKLRSSDMSGFRINGIRKGDL